MKKTYFFILALFLAVAGIAQQDEASPNAATLQGLKIAFISKQLTLTTDESEKFWPLYFTYVGEIKKARQVNKEDILALEEEILNIRKKYQPEFKKLLLTEERTNKVLTADRDFNNVLRKELQQRMQMRNKRNNSN